MKTIKVKNILSIRQRIPGVGDVGPDQVIEVDEYVANHLLNSGTWEEEKGKKNLFKDPEDSTEEKKEDNA